jgi:hypothetical protein
MLSTAYALSVKSTASPTGAVTPEEKYAVNAIVSIFLLLLVVDIAIEIFAIYALIKCSEVKKWPAYVPILLVLAMIMLPGIGWTIAIGVIIYYFASGCNSQQKLAFSFY